MELATQLGPETRFRDIVFHRQYRHTTAEVQLLIRPRSGKITTIFQLILPQANLFFNDAAGCCEGWARGAFG